MSNAYHQGREAAATTTTLCPYGAGPDRDDWLAGFEAALDDALCGR